MYFGFLGNQTQTGLHNSFLDIFLQNITQLELHLNKKKKKPKERENHNQTHKPHQLNHRKTTHLIIFPKGKPLN